MDMLERVRVVGARRVERGDEFSTRRFGPGDERGNPTLNYFAELDDWGDWNG